jgi:hypothetical protein
MRLVERIAGLALGLAGLAACTAPNPAYWVTGRPDAVEVPDASPGDLATEGISKPDAPAPPPDAAGADHAPMPDTEPPVNAHGETPGPSNPDGPATPEVPAPPDVAPDVPAKPDAAMDVPAGEPARSIDDRVVGTGLHQINYTGLGWTWCGTCNEGPTLYADSNTWSEVANARATLTFEGSRIRVYGVRDVTHGIGAISLDGGPEFLIDFAGSPRSGNVVMFDANVNTGRHQLVVRVTGTHSAGSTGTAVPIDRIGVD